jgi:hypothetical protein
MNAPDIAAIVTTALASAPRLAFDVWTIIAACATFLGVGAVLGFIVGRVYRSNLMRELEREICLSATADSAIERDTHADNAVRLIDAIRE